MTYLSLTMTDRSASRRPAWLRGCAFALALFGVAGAAQAEVGDVMREIERSGNARVIITMRTGNNDGNDRTGRTGLRNWAMARSVREQSAMVADAQVRVERSMSAAAIPITHRFRTLPFAGARVNRDQLLKLAAMSDVVSIDLVEIERATQITGGSTLERPALANSVPSIDVPAAWAAGYDGKGLTIAVLDGGFNLSHPMLSGKVVAEACFDGFGTSYGPTITPWCSSSGAGAGAASVCPSGSKRCNHGTHVASIAVGNDGINFGVARGAKLLPIDVMSKSTDPLDCGNDPLPCDVTNPLAVLAGLDYVNAHSAEFNIAAVNLSLGGFTVAGYCDDDPRKSVIDMLRAKGIGVAIAAGNDGRTGQIQKPSCISSAISVGATDNTTNVASFSNFANTLDLVAPGVDITAASGTGSGLLTIKGTSMAAPHVAGAWALLRAAVPGGTADQFEDALKQTGTRVTRGDSGITVPRIQVMQAINRLQGRGRKIFNQVVSSTGVARGQAFLRIYNNSGVAGIVVATVRDVDTGDVLGTWTSPTIPAHASPQVAIATIEAGAALSAGQIIALPTRTSYNIELESSFPGYVQTLLYAPSAGLFANMTSCSSGFATTDNTLAVNVNAASVADYVSHLRITNTGPVASAAVLTFVDARNGSTVASWTPSRTIPPGASIDVAVPEVEALISALAGATAAGATQYNVTLGSITGYLEHVIENKKLAALTNMTGKCALTASTAIQPPAAVTATR